MNKMKNVLWGLLLIAIGVVWALNAFEITDIDIFFDGWWTLILIIPCAIGLISGQDRTGNLIGVIGGVVLLLICQDILDIDMLWKLVAPIILVIIGVKIIFKDSFDRKIKVVKERMKQNGVAEKEYTAAFSGLNVDFSGEKFEGAELTAVFGGVNCNLRNAVIEEDAILTVNSIFGGADIYVPENVNVKISPNCIFGGVSDKRSVKKADSDVTLYINATCIFGGTDIK